jgi:multicomponent Na+:H+ antiporter subunit D
MIAPDPTLLVAIPLISAFCAPLLGLIREKLSGYIAIASSLLVLATSLLTAPLAIEEPIHYWAGGWKPPYGIELVVDSLSIFMLLLVSALSLCIAIYSQRSIEWELAGRTRHYYTLFLVLQAGMMGVIVTADIFNLYVFFEIMSIAAYGMIAMGKDRRALKASFNYLIMGSIAVCFVLIGIGYIYSITGSVNMADIASKISLDDHPYAIMTSLAFFIVGLSIKAALFPLHMWVPDAYAYAPQATTPLIEGAMGHVALYAVIRILFGVFGTDVLQRTGISDILLVVSSVGMIVTAALAMVQINLRKMLAYCSINQMGYIFFAISTLNPIGILGGMLHILNHAMMKVGLFQTAGAIKQSSGFENIPEFKGMSKRMPVTMLSFTIMALSIMGIPPLVGFVSKWYISLGVIASGRWPYIIIIIVNTIMEFVYYLRVINLAYFIPGTVEMREAPISMVAPTFLLVIACLFFGVFVGPLRSLLNPVIGILLGGV